MRPEALIKPALAELFGTTILAITIGTVVQVANYYAGYVNLFGPAAIALAVGVLVYALGGVSGAHFNPAVSIGMFVLRKIELSRLLVYLIAQAIGALLGFTIVTKMTGFKMVAPTGNDAATLLAELIGTFILVFVVTRVVQGRIPAPAAGLAIGGALLLGITVTMYQSNGILNPAVALALGITQWQFYAGQLLGGVFGALAAQALDTEAA